MDELERELDEMKREFKEEIKEEIKDFIRDIEDFRRDLRTALGLEDDVQMEEHINIVMMSKNTRAVWRSPFSH